MLGIGAHLLLEVTSAAAADSNLDTIGHHSQIRPENGVNSNFELMAAMEAAHQQIANSPQSASRFAAQPDVAEPRVAEKPWDGTCVDFPST